HQPTPWKRFDLPLACRRAEPSFVQLRSNEAGADGVDVDPRIDPFARQSAREHDDGGLAGGVGGEARKGLEPAYRRDKDDPAMFGLVFAADHATSAFSRRQKGAAHIYVHDGVEFLDVEIDRPASGIHAGVRDDGVNGPEAVFGLVETGPDGSLVGYVHFDGQ